jgi:hypothetical protein
VSPAARAHHLSPWGRLVAACAVVVGAAALTLGIWSLASSHERRVSYAVHGALSGMVLDLGDADLVVERAGRDGTVSVEHVDRYGFGHAAQAHRSVDGGIFRVRSRCPDTVLHGCSVLYRVRVPDNLPLTVRTDSGSVALRGYRGSARITSGTGNVDVRGFCGFSLRIEAVHGGDVSAATACPPPLLALRSTTGSVHVQVPAGRYRIDASTSGSRPVVRGIASIPDAPFMIQALSGSGSVVVERAS